MCFYIVQVLIFRIQVLLNNFDVWLCLFWKEGGKNSMEIMYPLGKVLHLRFRIA